MGAKRKTKARRAGKAAFQRARKSGASMKQASKAAGRAAMKG